MREEEKEEEEAKNEKIERRNHFVKEMPPVGLPSSSPSSIKCTGGAPIRNSNAMTRIEKRQRERRIDRQLERERQRDRARKEDR